MTQKTDKDTLVIQIVTLFMLLVTLWNVVTQK